MSALEVHVALAGGTVLAGTARIDRRRNATTTTFQYAPSYLSTPGAYAPKSNATSFKARERDEPDVRLD